MTGISYGNPSASRTARAFAAYRTVVLSAVAAIFFASVASAADVAGTARLIRERRGHTATAIGNGKILVAGGQNLSGPLADAEIFDSATGTFTAAARLLTPRAEHTATRLADGRVFLIGGRGGEPLTSTELYDATRNVFSSGPSLNSPRFGHTATLLPDGRLVVIGGNGEGTAEIFDPRAGTFTALPCHLSEPRSFHAAVRLFDGTILISGGINREGVTLKSAEILHPDTLECEPVGTMFAARSHFTMRMLPDGKVQAIGGDAERTMELFNPAGYFSSLAHLAGTAESESAALRSAGRAALIGPAARTISDSAEARTGGREAVRLVQNLLDRIDYSMTELPEAGVAMAAGGVSSTGRYQQTAVLFEASAATVTTDKTDYHPGEAVGVTGTGWLPGETVTLNFHRDTNDPPDTVLTAVADANGDIQNAEYVCQEFDVGVTFLLTATGQTSGNNAQTSFTDSRNLNLTFAGTGTGSVTITPSTGTVNAPVSCGGTGAAAASQTVTSTCASNITTSDNGATVTFTATAGAGSIFAGWSGQANLSSSTCSGTTSPCSAVLGGNPRLTVTFNGACDGKPNGFVCRASAGACDLAETCDGVSVFCPADAKSTAVCRADAGQCDVAESCDGVSNDCPADAFEPAATSCSGTSQGDICDNDAADHCSGTANTCVDVFKTASVTCRADAGQCDVAETCTGTSGACPADAFEPAATSCSGTSQGDICDNDAADHCSGTANTCVDVFKPNTEVCRGSAGQCDVAESCTGNSGACPADAFQSATTSCTGDSQGGACDGADHCSGTANTCVDVFKPNTEVCRGSAGQCDVAESCTGNSGACPADAFQSATTSCTGDSQGGACDGADHCSGTANTCVDVFKPNTEVCRPAGQCDVAESCTGTSGACPADRFAQAGTACSDGSACTNSETCNGSGECTGGFNTPPVVTSTSGPAPIPLTGGTANSGTVTAYYTDPDPGQTHTCTINWDDDATNNGTITEPSGPTQGTCTGSHVYTSAGVYTVTFTISDGCSGTGTGKFEFVVIYDPNGGFVTGGGWINSPTGAYSADGSLVGKANFGFVSKYKRGSTVPDGETEFQFKAGDLNFHSSAYDNGSLVISGYKATYKGTGTINGSGSYEFLVVAYDGDRPGGGGIDKFRIKITNPDSSVVYDNRMGAPEDMDAADPEAIGGGSIVIHK